MERLKELFIVIGEFFRAVWDAFLGVFLYTRRIASLMREKEKQDEKLFFKNEIKKKTYKWVVEERKRIKLLGKKLSKKEKDNAAIYNYICTVLLQKNPNDTVEDTIFKFYSHIHPYLTIYLKSFRKLRSIANSENPEAALRRYLSGIKDMVKDVPDMGNRAIQILETKKKVVQEIRALEAKHKAHKKKTMDKFDKEMYEIDKQIAEKQKRDAEQKLKTMAEMEKADGKENK